jgi:hypothetical protein
MWIQCFITLRTLIQPYLISLDCNTISECSKKLTRYWKEELDEDPHIIRFLKEITKEIYSDNIHCIKFQCNFNSDHEIHVGLREISVICTCGIESGWRVLVYCCPVPRGLGRGKLQQFLTETTGEKIWISKCFKRKPIKSDYNLRRRKIQV